MYPPPLRAGPLPTPEAGDWTPLDLTRPAYHLRCLARGLAPVDDPKRSGRPSPPPLTPAEQTALAERRALATPAGRLARRALLNCTCGPNATPRPPGIRGRHPSTCPAAPPPALRGWSEAAAARYVSFTR